MTDAEMTALASLMLAEALTQHAENIERITNGMARSYVSPPQDEWCALREELEKRGVIRS